MNADPLATPTGWEGKEFPATAWSSILGGEDSPRRRERLDQLCRSYWRPVFQFIRAASGASREDAKDLTQEFFGHFVSADLAARYDPGRGRFRHFLKGALRNHLSQQRRDENRLKRGGDRTQLPIDFARFEYPDAFEETRRLTPEQQLDLQWAEELLREGLARLREALSAQGKELYYRVYEAYDLAPAGGEAPTYEKIARDLGIAVHDVENHLDAARTLLRRLLLRRVSDYVSTGEELTEEMRELFPE